MRTHNGGPTTTQEDDEELDVNKENINRGFMECGEYNSDQNVNAHSNNVVGNDTSNGVSHRVSQNTGGSHLYSRSSISGTLYGKPQGSKGRGPAENGTANTNHLCGRSSICNNAISPGKPLGTRQE